MAKLNRLVVVSFNTISLREPKLIGPKQNEWWDYADVGQGIERVINKIAKKL